MEENAFVPGAPALPEDPAAMGSASAWWLLAILVLLVVSGFFSGSETALTAVNRASLHRLASCGSRAARTALRLTDDAERLIGGLLLGNNLVNILAASIATGYFVGLFGETGVALSTLVMTLMVFVFSELAPKIYAIARPEHAALKVAPFIAPIVRLFSPPVALARLLARGALRLFGIRAQSDIRALAPHEEIRAAVDLHHSEGAVIKQDRDMLLAALDLQARDVSEVMQHRSAIYTLDADLPPDEILKGCLESPFTRIPIWRDHPENIVGLLHAKDLLRLVNQKREAGGARAPAPADIMDIAMEPWFTPDTTSLGDQLKEFLRRRSHFSLVVDEYGVLQGMITLEDILEEIVGEIVDEHDHDRESVRPAPDGSIEVDGGNTIRDLNRRFDWSLPDDAVATIAGLVIHEANAIPEPGQIFAFHGFRFEILARERNRITRIRIRPLHMSKPLKTSHQIQNPGHGP